MVIDSAIFLKKIGSGTHSVTQNSAREGEVEKSSGKLFQLVSF
jgi:hypothetical protein